MTALSAVSPAPQMPKPVSTFRGGWSCFRVGLLRSIGLPASGLDLLNAPELSAWAEMVECGLVDWDEFVTRYDQAWSQVAHRIVAVADDPTLKLVLDHPKATLWQPSGTQDTDSGIVADWQEKERQLASYWRRYLTKTGMSGFFGPFALIPLVNDVSVSGLAAGSALTNPSHTEFEAWMVTELARQLCRRPEVRWWFPPMLSPAAQIDEQRCVLRVPGKHEQQLRGDELAVLRLADGTRSAGEIAAELNVESRTVRRVLLSQLKRRALVWDAGIPMSAAAWGTFRNRVAAIGDEPLREELQLIVDRFDEALAAAAVARHTDELQEALAEIGALFAATTGSVPTRSDAQLFAVRRLCYSDSGRAVDVCLGSMFLDAIEEPLPLVLRSANWFMSRLVSAYTRAITDLISAEIRQRAVRVSDIWQSTMPLFFGEDPAPLRETVEELSQRWIAALSSVTEMDPSRVRVTSSAIKAAVEYHFPDFSMAAELPVQGVGLQVLATGIEDFASEDFDVVLGGLHTGTECTEMPILGHGALRGPRDHGGRSVEPQVGVPQCPGSQRQTRIYPAVAPYGDADGSQGRSPGGSSDNAVIWPMDDLTVEVADGELVITSPDGRHWSVAQIWAAPISMVAADGFRIGPGEEHTPRLTIDRFVLFRESWQVPTRDLVLSGNFERHADYLAVRQWQRSAGLPDEVFLQFPTEARPIYLSFRSPQMVAALVSTVRMYRAGGVSPLVHVTEVLPRPQDSWFIDANGDRHIHEFRLELIKEAQ